MAYALRYTMTVCWIPDGAGAMSVPSAQVKTLTQSSLIAVPGGDAPTQGNFNTAISGASATPAGPSMANDLAAQVAANLAQIQGFATGGN